MKASYDNFRNVARIKEILLFASMCVIISYMHFYIEPDLIYSQIQKNHNKICIISSSGNKLIIIIKPILRRINPENNFYGTRNSYTIELFCVVNVILVNRIGINSLNKFTLNNLPRPPNLISGKNEHRENESGNKKSYQESSVAHTVKINPIYIYEINQFNKNHIINYSLLMKSFYS